MTSVQRVIKYLAIAFAILLIITIFSSIITVAQGIYEFFFDNENKEIVATSEITDVINDFNIELKYANLEIKDGDTFKVEVTNNNIKVDIKDTELIIKDNSNKKFFNTSKENVIISIPKKTMFDTTTIKHGAGKLNIDTLSTNKLKLELGVGKTTINNLISNESTIETGTGSLTINDCILNDSNIDVGVGALAIKGLLTGNNKINSGVGETTLELMGSKKDYKFEVSKGIGSIKFNNDNISNDTILGDGENFIKIEGGIGSIKIKTNEK